MVTPQRVIDRLLVSLHEAENGCLESTYSTGSHGYTQIGWHGRDGRTKGVLGHRVAWEAEYGAIPPDLTVDHLCRNRRCCNVNHLRLLSNVENARGNGNSIKTACPAGHTYDEENTYVDRRGHRRCRACATARRTA